MTRETCLLRIAIAHWAEKSTPAAAPTLPLSPHLSPVERLRKPQWRQR